MRSLLPILRLLRVGTLFSPAADVVASVAIAGLPWQLDVARAAFASVCLYAGGMVWNDVADRDVDARQRPERPLPRGDLSVRFAVTLGLVLFAVGLLVSPCRLHHAVIAALVLGYDFASKRLLALSVLGMGVLRGLNLATGLAIAGPIDPARRTDVLVAAIAYGGYIVAVTVLGICEDLPRARAWVVRTAQCVPPLAVGIALWTVQGGPWPAPALAALPLAAFLGRMVRIRDWNRGAIRGAMMWLLLGTMLYTGLLALAAGATWAALGIIACIWPARRIGRAIALT